MIQAKDLRVGNLVQSTSTRGYERPGIVEVISIGEQEINSFRDMGASGGHYYSALSGIPLTPEWLTKCGFEKVPINKAGTWSIKVNDRWILEIVEFADGYRIEPFWYSSAIQYVHQLQNLFYIFCGGELEIKPQS